MSAVRREHDRGAAHGEQQPAERRPEERADTLERARGDVRRRQLGRRGDERRQQRGLRGTEDRAGCARERDEPVDDWRRPVRRDDERGRGHEHESHDVRDDHDRDAWEAVDERRRERRGERRGEQPDQADEPDRGRAALVVRVDAERDEVRPVAEDRADPGELQPAQRGARQHRAEGAERGARATLALGGRPLRPGRSCHGLAHPTRNAGRFQLPRASGG